MKTYLKIWLLILMAVVAIAAPAVWRDAQTGVLLSSADSLPPRVKMSYCL